MKRLLLLTAALPLLVTACFNHTASLAVGGMGEFINGVRAAAPQTTRPQATRLSAPAVQQDPVSNSSAGESTADNKITLTVSLTGDVTDDYDFTVNESRLRTNGESYTIDNLPVGARITVEVSVRIGEETYVTYGEEDKRTITLEAGTNSVDIALLERLRGPIGGVTENTISIDTNESLTFVFTIMNVSYNNNLQHPVTIHISGLPAGVSAESGGEQRPLNNGTVTSSPGCTVTLTFSEAGTHTVTAYAAAAGYAPSVSEQFTITVRNPQPIPLNIALVTIEGATVTTSIGDEGGPFKNASAQNVEVKSFQIAQTELTYGQWKEVYDWATTGDGKNKGYTFANAGQAGSAGTAGGAVTEANKNQPVTNVSWRDAVVWCNAASERYGLQPVYVTRATDNTPVRESEDNRVTEGSGKADQATVDENANGYRLPTEAEWEFAARGGNPSAEAWNYIYAGTNDEAELVNYAVYGGPSAGVTSTANVKSKNPNGAQLYDMSGNVCEHCWDKEASSSSRVIRDGSWSYTAASFCTVANRSFNSPSYCGTNNFGFRVVRSGN